MIFLIDGENWSIGHFGILFFRDLLFSVKKQKWLEGWRGIHFGIFQKMELYLIGIPDTLKRRNEMQI